MLQKDNIVRGLLRHYDKDAEPPLMYGATNTTVWTAFFLQCATPDDDFVAIEGILYVVRKSHRFRSESVLPVACYVRFDLGLCPFRIEPAYWLSRAETRC